MISANSSAIRENRQRSITSSGIFILTFPGDRPIKLYYGISIPKGSVGNLSFTGTRRGTVEPFSPVNVYISENIQGYQSGESIVVGKIIISISGGIPQRRTSDNGVIRSGFKNSSRKIWSMRSAAKLVK